jgi:ribonuclease HI
MMTSQKEPRYSRTEAEAAAKSPIARAFLTQRSALNQIVNDANNNLVKRFYNIDHNTYMEGALSSSVKELMGLSVSAALRCDDCINYHIIQAWRLDRSRAELEEAINVALVIGGSIVIPHMRRAYALINELYSTEQAEPGL